MLGYGRSEGKRVSIDKAILEEVKNNLASIFLLDTTDAVRVLDQIKERVVTEPMKREIEDLKALAVARAELPSRQKTVGERIKKHTRDRLAQLLSHEPTPKQRYEAVSHYIDYLIGNIEEAQYGR